MTIEASLFIKKQDFTLDCNFKVDGARMAVVYGSSGSGKTTLLRCIAGLERPSKARLVVNGNLWQDSDRGIFLPTNLRKIGYISQKNSLFTHLSVKENLLFGYNRVPESERRISVEKVMKWLDIEKLFNREIYNLSGGEAQIITLARVLLLNSEILIMDEPLSAVDSKSKKIILDVIKQVKKEFHIPMLYVSHLSEEVEYLGEEVILIEDGRVI